MASEGAKSRFSVEEGAASGLRERAVEGYQRVEDMVGSNPGSAMLVCFGLGFGLGLLIGTALAGEDEPPRRTDYAGMAERLGRQILDSVSGMLPQSLSSLRG